MKVVKQGTLDPQQDGKRVVAWCLITYKRDELDAPSSLDEFVELIKEFAIENTNFIREPFYNDSNYAGLISVSGLSGSVKVTQVQGRIE